MPLQTSKSIRHIEIVICTNLRQPSLRTIVRSMLATSPPTVSASFIASARHCLGQTLQKSVAKQTALFEPIEVNGRYDIKGSAKLNGLLAYARSLYGAGMGFDSIDILTGIVRTATSLRWDPNDTVVNDLAIIDADISQAVQSCKEELAGGHVRDISIARTALRKLRSCLADCRAEVESWGGEFPFSRGSSNADCLQL